MAQRKLPSRPSTAGKSSKPRTTTTSGKASTKPASKPPTKSTRTTSTRPNTATSARPVKRKPSKSIVNQKQRPWGIIATVVVLVLVAGGIIAYAVTRNSGGQSANNRWELPELPAAKNIPGLSYKVEGQHNHVQGVIKYDSSPPRGGNHSQYWGDCTGTVYPQAIANENAVHMLEHGAVWVTYNPKTATPQDIATLKKDVEGVNYMAMSPYPGLKTPISLQAWGYQLFVQKASDPRVDQFISLLRNNQKTAPEYPGNCSDPSFKKHPSTFGHPLWTPAA